MSGKNTLAMNLTKELYNQVENGEKQYELRPRTPYWEQRLKNTSSLLLSCGFLSDVKMICGIEKILIISAQKSEEYGGPKVGSKDYFNCFKECKELLAIKLLSPLYKDCKSNLTNIPFEKYQVVTQLISFYKCF